MPECLFAIDSSVATVAASGYLRFPLFRLPAAMCLFGGAFQPPQRISGAFLQSAAEQDAHEPASPAARETKIAMVVDATSPVLKRNAVQRLVNRQAK